MQALKVVGITIAGILLTITVSYGLLLVSKFFLVKKEEIRTDVRQESQAYRDGMRTQLNNLYLSYQAADGPGKIGIAAATRDIFASVDTTEYPSHLTQFLSDVGAR